MAPVVLSPLCAAPPITSCVWPVQDWDCGKIAGATQLMLRTSPRYEVACPRPSGAFAHVAHRPAGRGPPCEGPCAWSASQVSPPRAGGGITLRGPHPHLFSSRLLTSFLPSGISVPTGPLRQQNRPNPSHSVRQISRGQQWALGTLGIANCAVECDRGGVVGRLPDAHSRYSARFF